MTVGGIGGAAVRRAKARNWLDVALPTIPPHPGRHELVGSRPGGCPELDCVRDLLPHRVLVAAEQRARSIGVGAERVLICADAITEEAYLTALADSLGTTYERFDGIPRAACPLTDYQLVQSVASGLLPLREGRGVVWIIAPPGITARQLADPRQRRPAWLQSFRLTSADRLRRFALQHSQGTLGWRAAENSRAATAILKCAAGRRRADAPHCRRTDDHVRLFCACAASGDYRHERPVLRPVFGGSVPAAAERLLRLDQPR